MGGRQRDDGLDVADGDGRRVTAGLLSCGVQVGERHVGDPVGIEIEGLASPGSKRSISSLEARARPPLAQASIRAASLTSSPSAVTSPRPAVVMLPTYRVDPQCSPKRITTSSGCSSLRLATPLIAARSARAALMHELAAADSDPACSARKKAVTPSPTWRPTRPPSSITHWSAARTSRRPRAK